MFQALHVSTEVGMATGGVQAASSLAGWSAKMTLAVVGLLARRADGWMAYLVQRERRSGDEAVRNAIGVPTFVLMWRSGRALRVTYDDQFSAGCHEPVGACRHAGGGSERADSRDLAGFLGWGSSN